MEAERARSRLRLPGLAVFAVAVGFVVFNYIDYGELRAWQTAEGIVERRGITLAGFYLLTYCASVAALVIALGSSLRPVRMMMAVALFLSLWLDFAAKDILGHPFGFAEAGTVVSLPRLGMDYVVSYSATIAGAAAWAAAASAVLLAAFRLTPGTIGPRWLLVVPFALAMAYLVIWRTLGFTDVYPATVRVPVLLAYAAGNRLYAGPRQPVGLTPAGRSMSRIVVLMDESVRGDFLGVNGSPYDTTPYVRSIPDRILNLGVAAAASNLSATSNLVVRSGLQLHEIPDRHHLALRRPGVFQHARRAGYRTFFLDAQSSPGSLPNHMTATEVESLDAAYQLGGRLVHEPHARDLLLIPIIEQILASNPRCFVYVNKAGAHIPYEKAHPPGRTPFTPTMQGRSIREAGDDELRNSYANAVSWTVDGFLERLLERIPLTDTILVYTSDHGQSLREGGSLATHGDRENPPRVQANVPMLLVGDVAGIAAFGASRDRLRALRDGSSHFQIFPSLLILMGYPPQEVTRRYGPPLWQPGTFPRRFVSGDVFGRGVTGINDFDSAGR